MNHVNLDSLRAHPRLLYSLPVLAWAALLGWAAFGDVPTVYTLAGGLLIGCATFWVSRREALARRAA